MLKSHIPLPNVFNAQNSVQLMRDLSDIPFVPSLKIASLDISDIHTNIPTEDVTTINNNLCFFFQFFTVHIVTIHIYSPTHAHFLNDTIKL